MGAVGAIILAAGDGKRFHSNIPKVLQEVSFKPLAQWVLDAVKEAGIPDVCMVTGHLREQVETAFEGQTEFCVQETRRGTAHAVMQARGFLERHKGGEVLILNGDAPFLSAATMSGARNQLRQVGADACVISASVENPYGYGRILRGASGSLCAIVEEKDATAEEQQIKEVNSGAYWFRVDSLLSCFDRFTSDNAQGEYYLPQAIELILQAGGRVCGYVAADEAEILGANDRAQQADLCVLANERKIRALMQAGVSFAGTDGVLIGPDTFIGKDTVILPGTILRGKTTIGEGCTIGPSSLITDSFVGDFSHINATHITQSTVGKNVSIGPFSQLRPNSQVADGVKIGNFVEVKNSTIGEKTSVAHLTYVGDSDVGEDVNFGCGTVTVNYDGEKKYRTTIGDHVFIGCNTNLIAPVTVEDESYIAAGSTITDTVPRESLAIARARQVVKEGWVQKKNLRRK